MIIVVFYDIKHLLKLRITELLSMNGPLAADLSVYDCKVAHYE